jgi:predicted acylesterase/phospholipase RssA
MEHDPAGRILSGGASSGASQVGIARALYTRDIKGDVIRRDSAEAISDAIIAIRPQG